MLAGAVGRTEGSGSLASVATDTGGCGAMAGAFAWTGGAAGPVDQMSRAESNAEAPVGTGL